MPATRGEDLHFLGDGGAQINAKTSGRKEDPCQGIPVGIVDRRVAILSLRLEGDFIKFSAQEML